MNDARRLFTSYDEAWGWFTAGGAIETSEERRERFTRGRAQFVTFQAPIENRDVLTFIDRVHAALDGMPSLTPQERDLLHISVRGVGFQVLKRQHGDEVQREEIGRIGERAARILKGVRSFEASFGPVNVFPDALILEVHDEGRFAAIRATLREAVAADSLIDDAHYLPHCTIASFAANALNEDVRARITELRDWPRVTAEVRRIDLARWWFTGFDERASVELETVRSYVLR